MRSPGDSACRCCFSDQQPIPSKWLSSALVKASLQSSQGPPCGANPTEFEPNFAALQDFMGFLHIGWELATTEDSNENTLIRSSPAWEAASKVGHLQK